MAETSDRLSSLYRFEILTFQIVFVENTGIFYAFAAFSFRTRFPYPLPRNSLHIRLNAKHDAANARITIYAASAAGIGAVPIPMSDAVLLTPLQITMSTHIIHIYGMENYANISKALIGDVVIANLGKAFAGGLLKMIPGIGTLVGGLINAGVASLITSALGFAISEICYDGCKKIAKGESVDFSSMFDAESIQTYIQEYKKLQKP